jgi:hypothetical protein
MQRTLNPRVLNEMASYDVASCTWQALTVGGAGHRGGARAVAGGHAGRPGQRAGGRVEGRHMAALELMGETSEENEELRERVAGLKGLVDSLTEKLAAP